ncbi:hypothetical protein [Viridibacterium curvum]|uniref:Glycosyltransferase RgtA/B/C/D-like domain-containing protein n=1 Tax=Viridibacterium curvum TaxID=1101404 RepID=A0ABP9QEV6_9RHOO
MMRLPSPGTAAWLLLAIALLPFALCSPLPLGDYINHLARMHIIAELPTNELLKQYYEVHWAAIPNLAEDMLVPPLALLIGVERAQLLFTASIFILIVTGVRALHRQLHGKSSWWPLVVFLLLYNRQFLWGFLNYLFAVGVMLWLLTFWLKAREQLRPATAVLFAIPTTLLFFCHLHPLAAFGLCVVSIEINRWHAGQSLRTLMLALLQFVPGALLMLFASPTSGRAGDIAFGSISNKVSGLLDAFNNYNLPLDAVTGALFFGALGLGVLTGRMRIHKDLRLAVVALLVCYAIVPNVLFSSFGADRRILIATLIILVAALSTAPAIPRKYLMAVAGVALALFGVRLGVIATNWSAAQQVYERLDAGFEPITKGSRVACLVGEPLEPFLRNPPLDHFCNLAVIKRQVFTNALFAEPGKQILRTRYNEDTPFNRSESQEYRFSGNSSQVGAIKDVITRLPLDRFDWVLIYHDRYFGDPRPPELIRAWRDEAEDASLYQVRKP